MEGGRRFFGVIDYFMGLSRVPVRPTDVFARPFLARRGSIGRVHLADLSAGTYRSVVFEQALYGGKIVGLAFRDRVGGILLGGVY